MSVASSPSPRRLVGSVRGRIGGRRAAATGRGGVRGPGRRRLPLLAAVAVVLGAGLLGGWLWVRDSSLVAVKRVTVSGVSGPDAEKIRSALIAAGRNQTTLDVQTDRLMTAVRPYPAVRSVTVRTYFPHGLAIRVVELLPVAVVSGGGRKVTVAGDGTLLHDGAAVGAALPTIPVRVPPGGARLSDPGALSAARLLGAAPWQMLGKVEQASSQGSRGLVVRLRQGPELIFGSDLRLQAKWAAAVAVLSDPGSAGALYVDVTDPVRPAAGSATPDPPASGSSAPASGASQAARSSTAVSAPPGG